MPYGIYCVAATMTRSLYDFLEPRRPTEGVPPWAWITTPEFARLCGVSQQSVYNWRLRRTGPPSVQEKSGRHLVRLADALSWIERGARSPDDIIVNWLNQHFKGLLEWSQGQVQDRGPQAALAHAIAYLERTRLVPRTRKPGRLFVPKYASAA